MLKISNLVDSCMIWLLFKIMTTYLHCVISSHNAGKNQYVHFLKKDQIHPAGDVLWVFVEPGNVVP